MPSSYTSRLKLERQVSGENSGTWGNLVNYVFNRLDASVKGYQAVAVGGNANVTLTSNNSTSNTDDDVTDDQVHNAVLEFTGTLTANIHVFTDAVETKYTVFNNTSGDFTLDFAPTGGTGVEIKQGTRTLVYTDGSTMYNALANIGDVNVTSLVSSGNITPSANDTYDLGSQSAVWQNLYTGDLHLSNQAKNQGNIVDGTKGNWTLQEGQNDIFLINNISGEKFKINLSKIEGDL